MASVVHLKGTTLEGGGQLLRIAVGVSALTAIPVEITDIRGNRSGGGGLKMQHLASVTWLGAACHARLSGAGNKSKHLLFAPDTKALPSLLDYRECELADGKTVIESQILQSTPGSIGLVFQAILPFLFFSGSSLSITRAEDSTPKPIRLRITGGTNSSLSPSYDYIWQVLLPTLALVGIPPIASRLHSRGWTHGGNKIGGMSFTVTPLAPNTTLPAFTLRERGAITHIQATILAPQACEVHFRDELATVLAKRSGSLFDSDADTNIDVTFEDSRSDKRFYLLLVATSRTGCKLGRDWLYDHRVKDGRINDAIRALVKQVVNELVAEIESGGCVDEYMQDQLVVFQALAEGRSEVDWGNVRQGSLHTRTAEWVCNEILGVEFNGKGGCEGIGLAAGEVFAERSEIKVAMEAKAKERDGDDDLAEAVGKLEV
ncbi:RNA 3'-terminal phosphate cyclase [Lophium mytilinum]|uniref:RNA 3'-terminal phosphate cyclase n=1 Tax=Lophium mytilinum TaxID=390894 RepID=A0A6A6QL61_9PEZI|nr:RNA 3'-terminal phosphate cyclase [Lophium mytilinum]